MNTMTRLWQLKYFFIFTPKIGEDVHPFWRAYVSKGLVKNHQPDMKFQGSQQKFNGNHLDVPLEVRINC